MPEMSADKFEVEIKSLLSSREKSVELVEKMRRLDPKLARLGVQKQLNHYFEGGNLGDLYENLTPVMSDDEDRLKLKRLVKGAKSFSLRTRQTNGKLLLILKISIDDTSSDNGTARMEFEAPIEGITFDKLEKLVLDSGFSYQAKWSRYKTDYDYKGANVTISFSPGYGYVAEFEKVITDPNFADKTKADLRELMNELGVEELSQDRLKRMFDYYNSHWRDYYGTDKVFEIR